MNLPQVVSQAEWEAAREKLLVKEKETTRAIARLLEVAAGTGCPPMCRSYATVIVCAHQVVTGGESTWPRSSCRSREG